MFFEKNDGKETDVSFMQEMNKYAETGGRNVSISKTVVVSKNKGFTFNSET